VDPFGSESFTPSVSGVTVDVPKKKSWWKRNIRREAPNPVTVNYTIDVRCDWGTSNGGKTDIASGTDPAITKDNYQEIVSDLTPRQRELSWVAPRSKYWSQAICERHEKYHSTDDRAWADGPGKAVVGDYLRTQTVSPDNAVSDATEALTRGLALMRRENTAFYKGGSSSYYSYAGEERAFGDGKAPYEALAQEVKAHGETLEKASPPAKTNSEPVRPR
jgi:hypothetical protein